MTLENVRIEEICRIKNGPVGALEKLVLALLLLVGGFAGPVEHQTAALHGVLARELDGVANLLHQKAPYVSQFFPARRAVAHLFIFFSQTTGNKQLNIMISP
jgi:hypothetical protein